MTVRIFTAALATETNTFSPIVIDRKGFEDSLYAPPGQHPDTPTLCTAPITVGRRVCAEKGTIVKWPGSSAGGTSPKLRLASVTMLFPSGVSSPSEASSATSAMCWGVTPVSG